MKNTKQDLIHRIEDLENKLIESEQMVEAIKFDKIDAFVISTASGDQIFTLQGADRPYRIFLEQMTEGAVTVSRDGMILYCNLAFAELLKLPLEKMIGTRFADYSDPQDRNKLNSLLMRGVPAKEEINFIRTDRSLIPLYLSTTFLKIEGIDPVLCAIATDLTEKKKSEELIRSEKLARSILDQAGEAIVVCDENMKIIRANMAAEALAGEPVLFNDFDNVFPLIDKNDKQISIRSITRNHAETEAAILSKDEGKIHLLINMGQLNGYQDRILGYVINLTNITKHITAEERLNTSLKEKTILLKEIHHRVKNNLQIISSLLALQSNAIKDNALVEILNECRNRVSSMAIIHQKLYESKSFSSISIPAYLEELIPSLSSSYQITNCKVRMEFPKEDVSLTIEAAIPLGLIMNELVTNALKHAFKSYNNSNEIFISLKPGDKELELIVSDNGSGFPGDMDFYNPGTLGLQLIHTLVQQLEGKIELVDCKGTKVKIIIPRT